MILLNRLTISVGFYSKYSLLNFVCPEKILVAEYWFWKKLENKNDLTLSEKNDRKVSLFIKIYNFYRKRIGK